MRLLHRPAGLLACIVFLAGLAFLLVEQSFAQGQAPERRFALVIAIANTRRAALRPPRMMPA